MMHRLLMSNNALPPALVKRLQERYVIEILPPPGNERDAFLRRNAQGIEAYATNAGTGIPTTLVEALPDLKVITSMGVGLDPFDLDDLRTRGITLGYTPEVLNDCVADHAFGLLMAISRRIPAADAFVRDGSWRNGSFSMTTRISGKRLGIVGMGRIGSVIARRAGGFDMDVRYHNRREVSDTHLQYVSTVTALADWADYLVVASAGGQATRGLISRDVLQALGPNGFLINVARGSVVDQSELVRFLSENRIAGAALDVFEQEPLLDSPLTHLDNVVLAPHCASNTVETRAAMAQRVIDNLDGFFAGTGVISAAV